MGEDRVLAHMPPVRLTAAEFGRAHASLQRRVLIVIGGGLFALFAYLGIGGMAMDWADVPPGDHPIRIWGVLGMIPLGIVFLGLLTWAVQDRRLRCPECQHSFEGGMAPLTAIVTGRCGKCAAPVFAERRGGDVPLPADTIPDDRLLARSVQEAQTQAALRPALQRAGAWVVAGVVIGIVGGLIGPSVVAAWEAELGEVWTPLVRQLLVMPGVAIGMWSLAVFSGPVSCSKLRCPHCGERPLFAWQTGFCSHCGLRAVRDPYPGIEAGGDNATERWSVANFARSTAQRASRRWIGCFVGTIPAFLGMSALFWVYPGDPLPPWGALIGFALLFVQPLGVILWQRHLAAGLRCPACRRDLLTLRGLVISSRRCYGCGTTVLENPAEAEAVV